MRPRANWEVLPNAVEGLDHLRWEPIPGRIIHHTSPDRGLYHLLERWGEIRQRVPNATLHVGGDPQSIVDANSGLFLRDSLSGEMARRLTDGMKSAKEVGGVRFLGALPRAELLEEIRHASIFAAPFEMMIPSETWSISVHECCEIGVPVVMAPADALRSLWEGVCVVTSDIGVDRGGFVDAVVDVLNEPARARAVSERQKRHVQQFSFDRMARELDVVIAAGLALRKTGTRVPV
jgi:glycosyltransferase involved in cell wall biosynthesis